MNEKFPALPLSHLADLSGGFAFKSEDYSPTGRFILRTLNIQEDGSISRDNAVFLPKELCEQYKKFELQPSDTLFVMVGATLGKIGYVREKDLPALLNQNMWLIRAKKNIADPRFISYAFRFSAQANLAWASGSAREFVRRDDYRNLLIPAPSLLEQRAIAGILGALDNKIELNRRMNRTLESMARAVFRQWFVEGEEVGNWKAGTVGDVVKRIPVGKKYDFKTALPQGAIPILDQSHFTVIGYHNEEPGVFASLDNPVLVFSNHRCYTDIIQFPFSAIQNVLPFVGDGVDTRWLYHATDGIITYSEYKGHYPEFISKPLVIPPEELTQKFGEIVKPMHIKILKNKDESRTLGSLRDSLLPKLMRGEVRVSEL